MNLVPRTPEASIPPYGSGRASESWGIHPLNAVALVTIDAMLFGGEVASLGGLIVLSLLVGAVLVLPCALVQRHAFKDPWGLALAKGLMLGLLTAIPTPIPSALTIALGVAGAIALRRRAKRPNVIDVRN